MQKSYRILHDWGESMRCFGKGVLRPIYIYKKAQIEIRAVAKIQYPIKSL